MQRQHAGRPACRAPYACLPGSCLRFFFGGVGSASMLGALPAATMCPLLGVHALGLRVVGSTSMLGARLQ